MISCFGMTYEETADAIRKLRPVMSINKGFELQLKAYAQAHCNIYLAQQLLLFQRMQSLKLYRGKGDIYLNDSGQRKVTNIFKKEATRSLGQKRIWDDVKMVVDTDAGQQTDISKTDSLDSFEGNPGSSSKKALSSKALSLDRTSAPLSQTLSREPDSFSATNSAFSDRSTGDPAALSFQLTSRPSSSKLAWTLFAAPKSNIIIAPIEGSEPAMDEGHADFPQPQRQLALPRYSSCESISEGLRALSTDDYEPRSAVKKPPPSVMRKEPPPKILTRSTPSSSSLVPDPIELNKSPYCRLSVPGNHVVRVIPPLRGLERSFCCSWCNQQLFCLSNVIRLDLTEKYREYFVPTDTLSPLPSQSFLPISSPRAAGVDLEPAEFVFEVPKTVRNFSSSGKRAFTFDCIDDGGMEVDAVKPVSSPNQAGPSWTHSETSSFSVPVPREQPVQVPAAVGTEDDDMAVSDSGDHNEHHCDIQTNDTVSSPSNMAVSQDSPDDSKAKKSSFWSQNPVQSFIQNTIFSRSSSFKQRQQCEPTLERICEAESGKSLHSEPAGSPTPSKKGFGLAITTDLDTLPVLTAANISNHNSSRPASFEFSSTKFTQPLLSSLPWSNTSASHSRRDSRRESLSSVFSEDTPLVIPTPPAAAGVQSLFLERPVTPSTALSSARSQTAEKTRWLERINLLVGKGKNGTDSPPMPFDSGKLDNEVTSGCDATPHRGSFTSSRGSASPASSSTDSKIHQLAEDDEVALNEALVREKFVYIEYLPWMGIGILDQGRDHGEIKCHNCDKLIGAFTWQPSSRQSHRGKLTPPIIRIHKKTVHEAAIVYDATPACTPRASAICCEPP